MSAVVLPDLGIDPVAIVEAMARELGVSLFAVMGLGVAIVAGTLVVGYIGSIVQADEKATKLRKKQEAKAKTAIARIDAQLHNQEVAREVRDRDQRLRRDARDARDKLTDRQWDEDEAALASAGIKLRKRRRRRARRDDLTFDDERSDT